MKCSDATQWNLVRTTMPIAYSNVPSPWVWAHAGCKQQQYNPCAVNVAQQLSSPFPNCEKMQLQFSCHILQCLQPRQGTRIIAYHLLEISRIRSAAFASPLASLSGPYCLITHTTHQMVCVRVCLGINSIQEITPQITDNRTPIHRQIHPYSPTIGPRIANNQTPIRQQ